MPPREDDVPPRAAAPRNRVFLLAGGFALAGAATLAVLLTDNPQVLKVAVIAVAWAFVLATFAAGRRDVDRVAAAAREAELRQAYEIELDREVAARRDYELELEHELRREAEDSMRSELDALRRDIAALSGLRDEVARVARLGGDIAALSGLRDEVARVGALRDDVAALMALRQDLGQLADLRADMGRLRAELTEQLSSEMLVERIVMRTQAGRLSSEPGRPDDGQGRTLEGSRWADDVPPRELTGGWPAIRLDEPRETPPPDQDRADRSAARPPLPDAADGRRHSRRDPEPLPWDAPLPTWEPPGPSGRPATPVGPPPTTMSEIAPASIARPPAQEPSRVLEPRAPQPSRAPQTPAPPLWQPPGAGFPQPSRSEARRPLVGRPPVPPPAAATPPSPLDWLAARSQLEAPAAVWSPPEVLPSRRRADDPSRDAGRGPQDPRTAYRPAVPSAPPRPDDRPPRAPMHEQAPATAPGSAQDNRLAEILAENGVSPSSGGRRRRRYRDEGEPDDVLARVLGQT